MHQCPVTLSLVEYTWQCRIGFLVGIVLILFDFRRKRFGLRSLESSTASGQNFAGAPRPRPGSQNNTQIGRNQKLIALASLYVHTVRKPK